jgi:hypothetical protein
MDVNPNSNTLPDQTDNIRNLTKGLVRIALAHSHMFQKSNRSRYSGFAACTEKRYP